jgi:hypothetical protein
VATADDEALSQDWADRVNGELEKDERLLWSSQPLPVTAGGALLSALPWMLFALVWFGFAVFIHQMTTHAREQERLMDESSDKVFQDEFFRESRERRDRERQQLSPFDIGGYVGMGITSFVGLMLLLSPLWIYVSRRRRRARTCYALTDRRALVWEPGGGGTKLHNYDLDKLRSLKRVERGAGTGDLVFEEYLFTYQVTVHGQGGHSHQETRVGTGQRGFLDVARVREVEKLIRQQLADQKARPGE